MIQTVEHPLGTFQVWEDLVGHTLKTGVFWDQQIQPTIDAADPNGWAIDLGANIGWFTVYMARRFQKVIAVEAHPQTFKLLETNVQVNGVADKVWTVHAAAYDRIVPMVLAPERYVGWPVPQDINACIHPASIAFLPTDAPGLTAPEYLEVVCWGGPIDDLIHNAREAGEPRVTLIKCDVQGCDLRALMGLRKTIERCRPIIIYEVETGVSVHHGDDLAAHEAWFTGLEYEVRRIREDLWDFAAWPKERL